MESVSGNENPAPEQQDGPAKATFVNLLPPATVLTIVLFWSFAPDSLTGADFTFPIAGLLIIGFIQLLELLFERHPGWRINLREFGTDLFYVALSYTIIAWASAAIADAPLASIKESLGIATPWLMELPIVIQAFLILFIIEFGQYWMHRAMHNWHPLWLTHAPHHHLTQLNAMKGYVGNPIELILITLSVVSLFDFDLIAIFCAINVLAAIVGFAHGNVRSIRRFSIPSFSPRYVIIVCIIRLGMKRPGVTMPTQ